MLSQSPGSLVIVWVVFPSYNRPRIAFEHVWNNRGNRDDSDAVVGEIRAVVAYERVFETVFHWEAKRLFKKWSLTGTRGGCLQVVIVMRECTVFQTANWILVKNSPCRALAVTKSDATNRLKSTTPSPPKVSDSSVNRCPHQARVSLSMTREEKVERGRIYCLHFFKFWWVFFCII